MNEQPEKNAETPEGAASAVERRVGHPWLTECSNKMHMLEFGRWLFAAQMARDFWANEEKGGFVARQLLQLAIVKHEELTTVRLTIHKLALWAGRVPNVELTGEPHSGESSPRSGRG